MQSQMSLSEVSRWYEEQMHDKIQPIYDEIKSVIEDCRDAQRQLVERCDRLTEAVSGFSTETSDRELAAKNASRLSESVRHAADNIRFPREHVYDELKQLSESLAEMVMRIHEAGRRFVPGLSRHFRSEVTAIDTVVKVLASEHKALDDLLRSSYLEVKKAEDLSRLIHLACEDERKVKELSDQLGGVTATLLSEERELEAKSALRVSLEKSECFKQLGEVEAELSAARDRFYSFFSPLEKPLRKAEKVASEGGLFLPPEAKQAIRQYLSEPYASFLNRETHRPLQSALQAVLSLLDHDKLELKDSKKRKTSSLINEALTSNLLGRLYDLHLSLQEKKKGITERMRSDDSYVAHQHVSRDLEQIHGKIRDLRRRQAELEQKLATLRKVNAARSEEIEKGVAKLLGQRIGIAAS